MNSLRGRLFFSHAALVLLSMVLVGVVLFAFLRNTAFTRIYDQHLLLSAVRDYRPTESDRRAFQDPTDINAITTYLKSVAEKTKTRVLLVAQDTVLIDIPQPNEPVTPLLPITPLDRQRGRITDANGRTWAFIDVPLDNRPPQRRRTDLHLFFLRPTTAVWQIFSENLLVPLLRASAIALLCALILSALLAKGITQPLQKLIHATRGIAKGDYAHHVPVQGATELRELASQFNQMSGQVADSQQAQRDFVANVSHELKTPLTSIQGFAQAIADFGSQDPAAAAQYAQIIQTESARMERLVTQLLALARWQAHPTLQLQTLDLHDLLENVVRSQNPLFANKNQTLRYLAAPQTALLTADPDRLRQVFTNLLANASQYTPSGGEICISTNVGDGHVQVQVSDTGLGIAETDLARIFERFYRADKARVDTGNAGLGLSIVQEIITAHHGQISVSSTIGKGSTFRVSLPLASSN